jgi:hypothetical protein
MTKRTWAYLISGIALLCAFIAMGRFYDLNKSEWAGWVQAVGSIVALGLALYIMNRQNKHAIQLVLDSDLRALRRRGESVMVLIQHAVYDTQILAEQLPEVVSRANTEEILAMLNLSRRKISEAKSMLIAIPAHELGSYAMTSALQMAIGYLSDTALILEQDSVSDIYANRSQMGASLLQQATRMSVAREAFEGGLEQLK